MKAKPPPTADVSAAVVAMVGRASLPLPLLVVAVWLWPQRAFALCPNCLGQRSGLTPTLQLVGLFLLVPFTVALVVYRLLRRALAGETCGRRPPERRDQPR
jgi:hypothetical protein